MYSYQKMSLIFRVYKGLRGEDVAICLNEIDTFSRSTSGVEVHLKSGLTVYLSGTFKDFWKDFAEALER